MSSPIAQTNSIPEHTKAFLQENPLVIVHILQGKISDEHRRAIVKEHPYIAQRILECFTERDAHDSDDDSDDDSDYNSDDE